MASPARVIKISTTLLRHFVSGVAKKFLSKERYPVATSFKAAFEELGPAFIKLGQFLSIRSDLIGHERTKVFESLQDNAPKLEFYKVKELVEHSLLAPIDELFKTFEERELAAASISQVHRAVTNAGDVVAVKIQRPDAAALLKGDVALFVNLALVLNKLSFINKHIDIIGFVKEIESSCALELDFRREGEIAERFKRNFTVSPKPKIPKVYWELTTKTVLTTEYISGHKISERATATGEEYRELALRGSFIFFRQVLSHGLFHADLHPSNVLITDDGEIAYVDFGIWGELSDEERQNVFGALAGMVSRDSVIALRHLEALGVEVDPGSRANFINDISAIIDSALTGDLADIDMSRVGRGILTAVKKNRVRFPHKYALLIKALLTIEGSARTLYSEFELERAASRYLHEHFAQGAPLSLITEGMWRGAIYMELSKGAA